MGKILFLLLTVFVFGLNAAVIKEYPSKNSIDDCSNKDSVTCVQLHIYRSMKSFFDQPTVDLLGGFSLVKTAAPAEGRSAASAVEATDDVEQREAALEDYAVESVTGFLHERSLRWDATQALDQAASTGRALVDLIPAEVKQVITDLVGEDTEEGRGRKKKIIKQLLPFLIGIKLKLGALLVLAALATAFIAKKAILASIVSIAISAFIGIKKLLTYKAYHAPYHHHAHEISHHGGWNSGAVGSGYSNVGSFSSPVAAYDAGHGGGWDASSSYGVHSGDTYGSHSAPVAHTLAFNGQKPKRR